MEGEGEKMTWAEMEKIAGNAICSELGNIPKTMAERVAKRIVEDVQIACIATDKSDSPSHMYLSSEQYKRLKDEGAI